MNNFNCDRTCPLVNERWCRFRPILDALGPVKVSSHTVKIKVEMTNPDALKAAVEAIGGTWIGQGTHRLFAGPVTGYGFKLPGWKYPLALTGKELAYDDYGGCWGQVSDLEKLKTEYSCALIEKNSLALGWLCERTATGIIVHHPSGGTLCVTDGVCETTNFIGGSCHEAREALGLAADGEAVNKIEFGQQAAQIQQTT